MSDNNENNYAINYHNQTKHSQQSVYSSHNYLDWTNRPGPFKIYKDIEPAYLPEREFPLPQRDTLECARSIGIEDGNYNLDTAILSSILFFSAGITRKLKANSEVIYMRAASATGALYPIEVYVICGDVKGINPGVYHFSPLDFSLTQLRDGDCRNDLSLICGNNCLVNESPVTIVLTSIAWRNAWKYRSRSYRHWFWDAGVISANLLATAAAFKINSFITLGFVDKYLNRLLRLDSDQEAPVSLISLGYDSEKIEKNYRKMRIDSQDALSKVNLEEKITDLPIPQIKSLSKYQTQYPLIWEINKASSLHSVIEAHLWNELLADVYIRYNEINDDEMRSEIYSESLSSSSSNLSSAILKRGSARRFAKEYISKIHLNNIIYNSIQGIPVYFNSNKFTSRAAQKSSIERAYNNNNKNNKNNNNNKNTNVVGSLIDTYIIINKVQDMKPGAYYVNRADGSFEYLRDIKPGDSGFLCLDQQLFADASAVVFLACDIEKITEILGNRGYRAAQYEAGVMAGKIYLTAYSQGLGASGSTFYDDIVTEFLSPHAKSKSIMIAVGIGITAYRARSGQILTRVLSRNEYLQV